MSKKMSKKGERKKEQRKALAKKLNIAADCKSSCCEKYKKAKDKRCKRCPMFDLIKKVA